MTNDANSPYFSRGMSLSLITHSLFLLRKEFTTARSSTNNLLNFYKPVELGEMTVSVLEEEASALFPVSDVGSGDVDVSVVVGITLGVGLIMVGTTVGVGPMVKVVVEELGPNVRGIVEGVGAIIVGATDVVGVIVSGVAKGMSSKVVGVTVFEMGTR